MSAVLRPGRLADLESLTEIINHYILETPATFDTEVYTLTTRRPWFDRFAGEGRYRLWVAELEGRVLGFASTTPFRPKNAYQTSVETSVYLHPAATGRGLGERLYRQLFESLAGVDLHRAFAGIALPNSASVELHTSFGFELVGVFHEAGRKFDRYWDVAWYQKIL